MLSDFFSCHLFSFLSCWDSRPPSSLFEWRTVSLCGASGCSPRFCGCMGSDPDLSTPPHDGKVHPGAFFSHLLSPAERKYDISNGELLVVWVATGWKEGAAQPYLVWTDKKKHEYIHSAKRLSAHQAHWSLFFDRFNLTPHTAVPIRDSLAIDFDLVLLSSLN